MDDLATWLTAQVDTDERVALAAESRQWHAREPGADGARVVSISYEIGQVTASILIVNALHIALNDPARALRYVKAMREIIALADKVRDWTEHSAGATAGYAAVIVSDTLRLLALQYADREGYREEWRPAVDLGPLEPGTVITPPSGQTVTWSE